jgi:AcrR family transcriptional regulator
VPRLTDTREQIMDRAAALLMQHGYKGFSYRDIATHLGVKNAAVHYHFPSKSDLALALVEQYNDILREQTGEFMASGGPALSQLEGLFAFTARQFGRGQCICPVGAFSVDYEELPEPVREATERFMKDSAIWMTQVLEVGRQQGEFGFEGDARPKAQFILSSLQGARQIARIRGPQVLEVVFAEIRALLDIEP